MNRAVPDSLASLQQAFTAHIRDPSVHPKPARVPRRRMDVYNELVFANIEGTLSGAFPVLHSLLPPERWRQRVRRFIATHPCRSPCLRDLPREFLRHLAGCPQSSPDDPPFMEELAHYEWVELALSTAPDRPSASLAGPFDPLETGLCVAHTARCLTYRFPVHRIGPEYRPERPPQAPTRLAVYRDDTGDIRFLALNPATGQLLERIAIQPDITGRRAVEAVAHGHSKTDRFLGGAVPVLRDLYHRGVLAASNPMDRGGVP